MAKLRCIGGSKHGTSVIVADGSIDLRVPLPRRRISARYGPCDSAPLDEELYRSRKLSLTGPFFSYTETVMVLSSVDEKTAREQLATMGICPNVDTLHQPQHAVSSSAVKSVGFDSKSGELDIVLFSAAYRYTGVPLDKVMGFLAASSKGLFFQREIKGQYECRKLAL